MAPEIDTQSPAAAPQQPQPQQQHQLEFFSRVSSLPIVNSALGQAKTLYDSSKSKYHLIDQLETSVKTQFLPFIDTLHQYDAQLAQVDAIACSGLDMLETRLPIILEPTEKVIENGRRLVDNTIITPVKTVTSSVSKSLEDGKQLIVGATVAVDERLKTSVYVAEALTQSEKLADRLLGPDENAKPAETAEADIVKRATHLGQSVGHRLTKHASEQFNQLRHVQIPTVPNPVHFASIHQAADIIKYTNDRLEEQMRWLQQFVATSQQSLAPAQQQLTQTASHLAQTVVGTLSSASTVLSAYVPENVRNETSRLQTLLAEQLSQIAQHRPETQAFYHRVTEAAETGRKYLDTVRTQLLDFYSTKIAQYNPLHANGVNGATVPASQPVEMQSMTE